MVNNLAGCGVGIDAHEPAQNMDKTAVFDITNAAEYFCNRFLHDPSSDEIVTMFLHSHGAACPYCNTRIESARAIKSFYNFKRSNCKTCGKWFTATTKTILQGCHNPRAMFLVAVLTPLGVDAAKLGKLLNIHPDSIRQWQKKFRAIAKI